MNVNVARLAQQLSGIVSITALVIGAGVLSAAAETAPSIPVPGTISTAASLLESRATEPSDVAVGLSSGTISSGQIAVSNSKSIATQGVVESLPADMAESNSTSPKPFSIPAENSSAPNFTPIDNAAPSNLNSASIPLPTAIAQNNTVPDTTAPRTTSPGTASPDTPSTAPPPSSAPVDNTAPAGTSAPDTTIVPGRATRSGSSYVGVGGNIGIGSGDTALGSGSFAILTKIGLTRSFSVRPSLLINDDVTILVPVTYDFRFGEGPTGGLGFSVAPYVGIGPAISTGDGVSADLLLTGGIDIPIGTRFTATAAVNATVTGNPAVGLLLGIGYNFGGF